MSHATVLVIGATTEDDVTEALIPFDESLKVPRYVASTKAELIAEGRKEHERFPEMLPLYKAACRDNSLTPGGCQVVPTTSGVYICNLATQVKPGSNARLKWVGMALLKMYNRLELRGLTSVAIPQIGCGIGGLEWSEVHPVIERHAQRFPHITTEIWTYSKEAL